MATETFAGKLGELRAASTAAGGTALTTTPVYIQLPPGTAHLALEGRNYSTAVVAQVLFSPYLVVIKTANAGSTWTDYSENAQDGSTSTDVTLSSLDTLANGDAVWIGSHVPFGGLSVDVDAANANASVLSVHYPIADGTMTDITPTDNTASGGATFAQDGTITWTVPTDWAAKKLNVVGPSTTVPAPQGYAELYWVRLTVSAALDASTTQNSIVAINRSTAYAELVSGRVLELEVLRGIGGVSAIQARTDAGTANLIVNVGTRVGRGFA